MLGLDDYGSDSDSDRRNSPQLVSEASQPPKRTRRPPKKIAIALPVIKDSPPDDIEDIERPVKRQKTGAGVSSLLSMLPTPKGSSFAFHSQSATVHPDASVEDAKDSQAAVVPGQAADVPEKSTALLFRPPSLAKGKRTISVEEPGINHITKPSMQTSLPAPTVDFFSLGATQSIPKIPVEKSTSTPPELPYASSAPTLPTFEPPEPTPTDPYPGYYQLPSGAWAAYDAEFYAKFMKKWQKEYDAHVRALEKGVAKGFEGLEDSTLGEVDAMKEMERAKKEIQEREERKAITMGAGGGPVAPRMTMTASKMSGIARSRHQLSTLLREAYENREALEERIAQGKRNRKEAGNKYGF